MRKYLLALFFCLVAGPAWAQCNGVFAANQACGTGAAGVPSAISLSNLYNHGGPTAYSAFQIGGQVGFDSDPSLTHNSSVLFSINANNTTTAIVLGMSTTGDPNGSKMPWIQARDWSSNTAHSLLIQPGGGYTAINVPISGMLGPVFTGGVQIGTNWANTSSYNQPSSSGFQFATAQLNVFGDISQGTGNSGITLWATDKNASASTTTIGLTTFCYAESALSSNLPGCWGIYGEGHRKQLNDFVFTMGEFSTSNEYNGFVGTPDPFLLQGPDDAIGGIIDCGTGVPTTSRHEYDCSAALMIDANLDSSQGSANTVGFLHGIIFGSNAFDTTNGLNPPDAIAMAGGSFKHAISWYSATGTRVWLLYSDATSGSNSLQFHNAEAQLTATLHIAPPSSSIFLGTNIVQSAHGTPGASNYSGGAGSGYALNNLTISSDDMVVGSPISLAFGWAINHTFGGSNMKGDRSALEVAANLTATSGNVTTGLNEYVGGTFYATSTVNDNGTNTGAGALGSVFAMNPFACLCSSSATNYSGLNGAEVDISNRGGTVKYKFGWRIVLDAADNGQGVTEDGAFVVGGGGGHNTGWKAAFLLDDLGANNSPVGTAGCILCTVFGSGPYTITTGIDLTGFTMSGNAFKSTSFTVDGSGNLTANAFTQGANAGVDCLTGVTAGTVVVHKGIVTHC